MCKKLDFSSLANRKGTQIIEYETACVLMHNYVR